MLPLFFVLAFVAGACSVPFGIYHTVGQGETLYRIARTYNIPVQQLIQTNRLSDPDRLRPGQSLFVPGANRQRLVSKSSAAKKTSVYDKNLSRASSKKSNSKKKTWVAQPKAGKAPTFIWPVNGKVTSGYGVLNDRTHDGLDIAAPAGTKIAAASEGTVIYAGSGLRGYGNLIIVKHKTGYSTIYAHNKTNLVKKGSYVGRGETIGTVGSTGRSSGPHLHFEIRKGKKPVNPIKYLPTR